MVILFIMRVTHICVLITADSSAHNWPINILWVCQRFVIVVFPDHTHLLVLVYEIINGRMKAPFNCVLKKSLNDVRSRDLSLIFNIS